MIFNNKEIVLPETLDLLKKLQQDPRLTDFFLVGGTALALQIGHRLSIDLDLFTQNPIDTQQLETYLNKKFDFFTDYVGPNTLKGFIKNIKADFITHDYPLVRPLIVEGSLRLASLEDIAAMKLNAIAHSGYRQKDFYDLYFLLEHHSLKVYLKAYQEKYPHSNPVIPLKGIVYFDDIDFEIEQPMLQRKVSFKKVKERLLAAAKSPDKVFE